MAPQSTEPTRRGVLRGAATAAGAVAAGSLARAWAAPKSATIDRIEITPISYPTVGRFKFFEDARGRQVGRVAAVVKMTADDGTVGWGQAVPSPKWSYETLASVTTTLRDHLAPVVLGRSVFDLAGAHKKMNTFIGPGFTVGAPIAKAGIDIAMHDLACKINDQTLAQKWGRKSVSEITLSWTLNPKKLDDLPAMIARGTKRGYKHFNVKVAPDPKFDVAMCRTVKKLAPDGFLWADANGGYDLTTAMAVLPKLADAGVDVLEQPLKTNRLAGYRRLHRQGALPIYMDEGMVSPADVVEMIRLDALDGVAMKPARCGGLVSNKRQIEIVLDAGLDWLGSGLCDPDISLAATLALYGAFGYKKPAALNGAQFLAATILKNPIVPKDGKLPVQQTRAGLGVDVDEDKLKALVVKDLVARKQ